ncbi:MAG: zinc ribbon domain-containing protein [Candidatus Hodarchaeales archaeon]
MNVNQRRYVAEFLGLIGCIVFVIGWLTDFGLGFALGMIFWLMAAVSRVFLGLDEEGNPVNSQLEHRGIVGFIGIIGILIYINGILLDSIFPGIWWVGFFLVISIFFLGGVLKEALGMDVPIGTQVTTTPQSVDYPQSSKPIDYNTEEPTKKICVNCGHVHDIDSRFCSNCGQSLV